MLEFVDCNWPAIPFTEAMIPRRGTVAEESGKSWKELCSDAMEAEDPDRLLKIIHELNQVLKRQEQRRRNVRGAINDKGAEETQC
jgi:hypothetical protein